MDKTQKDVELYQKWKQSPTKQNFQNIYRHMLPVINKASQKASMNSQVPKSVFKLEAAQQFHDALNRFDPKFGVKLNTYIHSNIEPKLNRVNATYQNIARIPERGKGQGGVFDINQLLNAEYMLEDKLGRKPSDVELAQEMGFTPENVGRLRNELRRDLSLNEELEDLVLSDEDSKGKETEYMIYYDLPPEGQLVYDLARGLHGKQAVLKPNGKPDWKRIGQQLGMSDTKVRKITKMIANEMKRYHM